MRNAFGRAPRKNTRTLWVLFLLPVACLLSTISPASAQLSTASLNGVVRDPSGAVIAKANVVLRNTQTTIERTSVSNDPGESVLLNVTPGTNTPATAAADYTS